MLSAVSDSDITDIVTASSQDTQCNYIRVGTVIHSTPCCVPPSTSRRQMMMRITAVQGDGIGNWEPQGPQMRHMNVLELSVSTAMLRCHTKLARERGGL